MPRPTIQALARNEREVKVGDLVPFWTGEQLHYHVVTVGDMHAVARYKAREPKRREAARKRIADWDRQQDQLAAKRRADEARVRQQQASAAMARIAGAR